MKRWFQPLVTAIILGCFAWVIITQRTVIATALEHVSAIRLALVLFVTLPMYPLTIAAWRAMLEGIGGRLTYRQAFAVWMLGNVARFLPAGSLWQWVGRAYAAEAHGVSKSQTLLSSAYEVVILVVSSFVVILATLPFWPTPVAPPWWLSLIGIAALIGLWPKTLPWIVGRYGRLRKQPLPPVPVLPWTVLLRVFGYALIRAMVSGLAVWLLVSYFVPLTIGDIIWIIGAYRLAWLIGYVTLFAPGGIGVADTLLAGLLVGQVSFGAGLAVALIYRAIFLINEVIMLVLAVVLHPEILGIARGMHSRRG